jgi:hypothetical protein
MSGVDEVRREARRLFLEGLPDGLSPDARLARARTAVHEALAESMVALSTTERRELAAQVEASDQ